MNFKVLNSKPKAFSAFLCLLSVFLLWSFSADASYITGSGSQWTQNGSTLYYNGGNIAVGTSTAPSPFTVQQKNDTDGFTLFGNYDPASYFKFFIGAAGANNPRFNTNRSLVFEANSSIYLRGAAGGVTINDDNTRNIYLATGGGNVGIGNNSPGARLDITGTEAHVSGDLGGTDAILRLYNDLGSDVAEKGAVITFEDKYLGTTRTTRAAIKGGTATAGNTADGFLSFYTDSGSANTMQERMRIIQNGNVGIGTSTPGTKLTITGGTGNALYMNGGQISGLNSTPVNADQAVPLGYLQANYSPSTATNLWKGTKNANIWNGDTGAGNVGIGTTTPGYKLDVVGDIRTSGSFHSSNPGGYWFLNESGGAQVGHIGGLTVSGNYNDTPPSNGLYVSGNVGIGTGTPAAKLDVNGNMTVRGVTGINAMASAGATNINVLNINTALGSTAWSIGGSNTGNDTFMLWAPDLGAGKYLNINKTTGNVGIGTTAPWTTPATKLYVAQGPYVGSASGFSDPNQTGIGIIGSHIHTNNFNLDTTYVDWATWMGVVGIAHDTASGGRASIGVVGIGDGGWTSAIGGRFVGQAYGSTAVNAYGVKSAAVSISGSNGYGVYIDAGSGPGTNYGLYQAGSGDKNYLAGNVGIGTTTPGTKLSVSGGTGDVLNMAGGQIAGLNSTPVNNDQAVPLGYLKSNYVPLGSGAGGIGSGTSGQTLRHNGTSWVANSTLYNNGTNVGIGTNSPDSKLKIVGSGSVPTTTSSNSQFVITGSNNRMEFGTSDIGNARYAWILARHETVGTYGGYYSTLHLQPDITGVESDYEGVAIGYDPTIKLNSSVGLAVSGNVGVGTTNPVYKIDVNGEYSFNRPAALVDTAGGVFGVPGNSLLGVIFAPSDLATNNGYFKFSFPDANSVRFNTDYDGNLGAGKQRDIQFGSNVAVNMTIKQLDNSGNIGISTTTPQVKLVVDGGAGNVLNVAGGQISGLNSTPINADQAVPLGYLQANYSPSTATNLWKGTKNANIWNGDTGAGNVGIGTTDPKNKLHVAGSVNISTNYTGGLLNFQGDSVTTIIRSVRSDNTQPGLMMYDGWNNYLFSNKVGIGTSTSLSGSTATLFVNGSVGVGTTAPAQSLDVNGVINAATGFRVANSAGAAGTYLRSNGTNFVTSTIQVADIPTLNQNSSGYAATLYYEDNRTISPSELSANRMRFGFTAYNNNNTSPWADFIHLRSYQDSSGGNDNLLVFNRNAFGMRLYQQAYGTTTPYAAYKDVLLSENSPTANYLTKYSGVGTSVSVSKSLLYDNGTYVGIGTTTPTIKLVVSNGTGDVIWAGGGYVAGLNLTPVRGDQAVPLAYLQNNYSPSTSQLWGGTKNANIWNGDTGAGNVGIGLTNPTGKLHIVGVAPAMPAVSGTTQTGLVARLQGNGTGGVLDIGNGGGGAEWLQSTNAGDLSAVYSLLLNPNGGNVGIGTTNPGGKLEVNAGHLVVNGGDIYFADAVGATRTQLKSYNNASSLWIMQPNSSINLVLGTSHDWDRQVALYYTPGVTGTATGNLQIGQLSKNSAAYTHGITSFYTNGAERMRINSSGYVGIGKTNPGVRLDVTNDIAASGSVTATGFCIGSNCIVGWDDFVPMDGNVTLRGPLTIPGLSISTSTLNMNNNNITNANKLTVAVIDPLYSINGTKYSTYASSIAGGLKEEYVGKANVNSWNKEASEFEKVIDFDNIKEGTDLWVWRKVIKFNKESVEVAVTPYGQLAQVYYLIDGNKLIFRSDKAVEVSYRLTARRYDWLNWPTKAKDQSEQTSLIIND